MSSMSNATIPQKPLYGARRALADEEARQRQLADLQAEEEYNKIDKSKITRFVQDNPDNPITKTFLREAREAAKAKAEVERAKRMWKQRLERLMTTEGYIMLVTEG